MPLATTELSLAGVRGELECAICTEVMEHPCSLSCAHSFCKACLEKAVGEDGSVRCPMCRKRSITRDGFVENKTLRVVCEHARAAHKAECPTHEGIVMDYYCSTCDELICDRCAILGDAHRGHAIDTIAHRCAATRRELKAAHEEVSRRSNAIDELVRTGGRIDAAHDGLLTRVDEAADEAIARIEALRAQARDALLSHARVEKAALRNAQRPVAERARHLDAAAATLPRVGGQLALAREAREGLRLPELQPPTWDAARAAAFLEQQPPFTELRRIYTASGADREAAMQACLAGHRPASHPRGRRVELHMPHAHTPLFAGLPLTGLRLGREDAQCGHQATRHGRRAQGVRAAAGGRADWPAVPLRRRQATRRLQAARGAGRRQGGDHRAAAAGVAACL